MIELLSSGTERPRVNLVAGQSTLVVDGQALVMALGRPSEYNTFDDFADKFVKAVLVTGNDFDRIDVTFDSRQGNVHQNHYCRWRTRGGRYSQVFLPKRGHKST